MSYDAYDLSQLDPDMSVEDIMKQITIDGRSHVIVDQQEAFNTSMNYRHYADGLGQCLQLSPYHAPQERLSVSSLSFFFSAIL